MIATPRDLLLARRAKRAGAAYALRIIWEARAAGLPISLGFAIVEEESSDRVTRAGRNVYGHDDVRNRAPTGGLRLYNGSGQPARDYAKRVLQRQRYWHKVLMG
jgi:hypothetical protein